MWYVWRVWLSGLATLQELDEHWTLKDVMLANNLLDLKTDAESRSIKATMKKDARRL